MAGCGRFDPLIPIPEEAFDPIKLERRIFMYIEFPYTLFYDAQAAVPEAFCIACGCECYAPGLRCLRCDRRDHVFNGIKPQL